MHCFSHQIINQGEKLNSAQFFITVGFANHGEKWLGHEFDFQQNHFDVLMLVLFPTFVMLIGG